ncbi:hypothetical protein DFA_10580 [Cavenderia fasciculata]|uniref:Uncharacterized protein n=1 Tax=Cavenderia fasciculata TaxID=261658 RepID=F4QAL9_CACFS|nr:uncharacterized protein DFA_10580 [Cavenderia fasciculata]EGG15738.1 hypothetical protein DFA_10580 [Cavenderia fasciculata]|eukprot:XP_004354484.1 hypothetical protein DFA_10580 [Cavenderia fasciculata]
MADKCNFDLYLAVVHIKEEGMLYQDRARATDIPKTGFGEAGKQSYDEPYYKVKLDSITALVKKLGGDFNPKVETGELFPKGSLGTYYLYRRALDKIEHSLDEKKYQKENERLEGNDMMTTPTPTNIMINNNINVNKSKKIDFILSYNPATYTLKSCKWSHEVWMEKINKKKRYLYLCSTSSQHQTEYPIHHSTPTCCNIYCNDLSRFKTKLSYHQHNILLLPAIIDSPVGTLDRLDVNRLI